MGGIKAITEQIEEDPGHLLGRKLNRRKVAIKLALQCNVETRILGAGTVVSEIEGFLDQRVQINTLSLAAAPARMCQHALDDVVGAPAVLSDFVEVASQQFDRLIDLGPGTPVDCPDCRRKLRLQIVQQFNGQASEVIDEIEWVLDFVGDASG